MIEQLPKFRNLRRLKFWDVPESSGLEIASKCSRLQVKF